MPKKAPELTAIQVKRITQRGAHPVGGVSGLLLRVAEGGSRSWILRAKIGAKRRDMGLGAFPDVTLAQAREAAREAREKIRQGIDPIEDANARRKKLIASQARMMTFEQAARYKFSAIEGEFRNKRSRGNWIRSLEMHVFPHIGEIEVAVIELPHIISVLQPIWREKTDTAQRVRQRIEAVLDWATVSKHRRGENPARWRGNLAEVLPKPAKIRKVQHYRALPWQQVPEFIARLRQRSGMSARALEFAVLTAARSGETRFAAWDEIDTGIWRIPAERMKNFKPHNVPLAEQVIDLIDRVPAIDDSPLIFTAPRGGPLSDMSLSSVTKKMGVDAVPHGFRSSFKDWCRVETTFADEVSELALAHVSSDATRSAYARDELLGQRREIMAQWAAFCYSATAP